MKNVPEAGSKAHVKVGGWLRAAQGVLEVDQRYAFGNQTAPSQKLRRGGWSQFFGDHIYVAIFRQQVSESVHKKEAAVP